MASKRPQDKGPSVDSGGLWVRGRGYGDMFKKL